LARSVARRLLGDVAELQRASAACPADVSGDTDGDGFCAADTARGRQPTQADGDGDISVTRAIATRSRRSSE
jgi:hypothetical protein